MIISEILGNAHATDGRTLVSTRRLDHVVIPDQDLVKRIQRVTADSGRQLGLRLPADAPDLRDGDILQVTGTDQDGDAVVVSVLPTDVLVISPVSITQMGFVAHSLGNRHLQAQFFGTASDYGTEVMVVQYDHTVVNFLEHHGIPHHREDRVMPVPFRHSGHSH